MIKIGSWNKELLQNALKDYFWTVIGGVLLGTITEIGVCAQSLCFDNFNFSTYMRVPAFIGALGYYVAPTKMNELQALTLSQWVLYCYNFF